MKDTPERRITSEGQTYTSNFKVVLRVLFYRQEQIASQVQRKCYHCCDTDGNINVVGDPEMLSESERQHQNSNGKSGALTTVSTRKVTH